MPPVVVKLHSPGMREMLQSEPVASALASLAQSVAENARASGPYQRHEVPVEVGSYTSDRAVATVSAKHAGALPIEAKHGTLTQAAKAAGLDVKERS